MILKKERKSQSALDFHIFSNKLFFYENTQLFVVALIA